LSWGLLALLSFLQVICQFESSDTKLFFQIEEIVVD